MIPVEPYTMGGIAVGALFAVGAAAATAVRWRSRWMLPELALLLGLGVLFAMGVRPTVQHLDVRILLGLLLLAALQGAGRQLSPRPPADLPLVAAVGSLFCGALPVIAALTPHTRDARHAARLALWCTAIQAASPLGPAQLLCTQLSDWMAWAAVPAVTAAIIAWPGTDEHRHVDPTLDPWPLVRLVRWALVAWGLGALVSASGVASLAVAGLSEQPMPVGPVSFYGLGALAGCLGDPWLLAAAVQRVTVLHPPHDWALHPLVLGLALAPVLPLAVASWVHGREVWRHGLPVAGAQLAVAMAWVWLT